MTLDTGLQVKKFKAVMGNAVTRSVLDGEHGVGLAFTSAARAVGLITDQLDMKKTYGYPGTGFNSSHMRLLDPHGWASTLLYDAWWYAAGYGLLAREDYYDIMGFPRSYRFPANLAHRFREFLSRGVCPPVAQWLLTQVAQNLDDKVRGSSKHLSILKPGETADFLVAKSQQDEIRQLRLKEVS